MATYTVIQDIEAEDKFVGPLTLKQFAFAGAGLFFAYLCVFAATRGGTILILFFGPPALLGFFLAIPWSKDQPTEVWVLAKLRFKFKPKARIWDQSGLEELVTVTAPKKIEKKLTNGLDSHEVQSRLKALAETIDSRGWAIKHATNGMDNPYALRDSDSQRLVDINEMPGEVPDTDLRQYNDVLDDTAPISENFSGMIQSSSQAHRQRTLENMNRVRNGQAIENEQHFDTSDNNHMPGLSREEAELIVELRKNKEASDLSNNNMHQFRTNDDPAASLTDDSQAAQTDDNQAQAQMTDDANPDIINLSRNNDRTVDSLAREANRNEPENDEVVISLR